MPCSHEGDKYYSIITGPKVSSTDWSRDQVNDFREVEVYEFTDMMDWTCTDGDDNGSITINASNVGMTWTLETYRGSGLSTYMVSSSSRMFADDTRTTPIEDGETSNNSYAQVRCTITRDFVSFTEPRVWQDTGYSRIDSTVRKAGGYYY